MDIEGYIALLASQNVQLWVEKEKLRYRIPDKLLTDDLISELKAHKNEIIDVLTCLNNKVRYPLSFNQQAIWMLYQLRPENPAYNTVLFAELNENICQETLCSSIKKVIDEHEVLNINVVEVGGQARQYRSDREFSVELVNCSGWPRDEINKWLEDYGDKPFDLFGELPIRVALLADETKQKSKNKGVIAFTAHHISADFWTLQILAEKISETYQKFISKSPVDEDKSAQYSTYIYHQQRFLEKDQAKKQKDYWKKQLNDHNGLLSLNADYPYPKEMEFEGDSLSVPIPENLFEEIKNVSKGKGITPFSLILSCFYSLLWRYSGDESIVIGTPTLNRNMKGAENIVGDFANPIALRCDISSESSLCRIIEQVKQQVTSGLNNQDYPFSLLLNELDIQRKANRAPLFQVMYVWHQERSDKSSAAYKLFDNVLESGLRGSAYELILSVRVLNDKASLCWNYKQSLYREETISQMADFMLSLLQTTTKSLAVNANPRIHELSGLPADSIQVSHDPVPGTNAAGQLSLTDLQRTYLSEISDSQFNQVYWPALKRELFDASVMFESQEDSFTGWYCNDFSQLETSSEQDSILISRPSKSPMAVLALCKALSSGAKVIPIDALDVGHEINRVWSDSDDLSHYLPFIKSNTITQIVNYGGQLASQAVDWVNTDFRGTYWQLTGINEANIAPLLGKMNCSSTSLSDSYLCLDTVCEDYSVLTETGKALPLLACGLLHLKEEEKNTYIPIPSISVAKDPRNGIRLYTNNSKRYCWRNGYFIDLTRIEAVINRIDVVVDCKLGHLRNAQGRVQIMAYVCVPEYSRMYFEQQLQDKLSAHQMPNFCQYFSSLPVKDSGDIDYEELSHQFVFSAKCKEEATARLKAKYQFKDIAIVETSRQFCDEKAHLWDNVPNIRFGRNSEGRNGVESNQGPIDSIAKASATVDELLPLSLVDGEPLKEADLDQHTLIALLQHVTQQHGNNRLTFIESENRCISINYSQLWEQSLEIMSALVAKGVQPQDKVILQFEDNHDIVKGFWGTILAGAVPVPVAYTRNDDRQKRCQKLNNIVGVLGSAWVLTVEVLSNKFYSQDLHITEEKVLCIDEPFQEVLIATPVEVEEHGLGLILFTSGSTGDSKGVMQTHSSLVKRSLAMKQMKGYGPADVSLNWMPLDHVGGIVMFHLMDLSAGASQIQVKTNIIIEKPVLWLDYLEEYKASITWAPNFAYGLINANAVEVNEKQRDLSALRLIINGGEAIVCKTARQFLSLLSKHKLSADAMSPSWGMSETCSGIAISHDFTLKTSADAQKHVSVGGPIPGISMRIVDNNNRVLPVGSEGKLQVKGHAITKGYYQNLEQTKSVFTEDGWFETGDLGQLENGCLLITGRIKDTIIINGVNFYCHHIESLVESLDDIKPSYTAACSVQMEGSDTDKVIIFFCPTDGADAVCIRQEIKQLMSRELSIAFEDAVPLLEKEVPKTSIGKIKRVLLRENYLAGLYDETIKSMDKADGHSSRTLESWLFQKSWQARKVAAIESDRTQSLLVFSQDVELLDALAVEESLVERRLIRVSPAEHFSQLAQHHFEIDFHSKAQIGQLLEVLSRQQIYPENIAYVVDDKCPLNIAEASSVLKLATIASAAFYPLLLLIQSLAGGRKDNNDAITNLHLVTYDMQSVVSDEQAIDPTSSALTGLLKTVKTELPWLRCGHLDIDRALISERVEAIAREINLVKPEAEVAVRAGKRYVPRLKALQYEFQTQAILPRQSFAISGGLGGLGYELAKFLITHFDAKLLLLGRTDLAKVEQSEPKRLRLQKLQALTNDVYYRACDIADFDKLQAVVSQTEENWKQNIAGIFHLAGEGNLEYHWTVADKHHTVLEKPETFEWMYSPKIHGTINLSRLLVDRPDCLFVNFCSINAEFGGASFSAYSSACAFQDYFCRAIRPHHPHTYCYKWSMWDDVGMSKNNPEYANQASSSMGYRKIDIQDGMYSMVAALNSGLKDILIGLDGNKFPIASYLHTTALPRQEFIAFCANTAFLEAGESRDMLLEDSFGNKAPLNVVELDELITSAQGEVDINALLCNELNKSGVEKEEGYQSDTERLIGKIWSELLKTSKVGRHSNFFELGGHSLLASQIIARIQSEFNVRLPLAKLFEYATLSDLAALVDSLSKEDLKRIIPRAEYVDVNGAKIYPVSSSQQRMWSMTQLGGISSAYNIPVMLKVQGRLSVQQIEDSFNAVLLQQPAMRTRFDFYNQSLSQWVLEDYRIHVNEVTVDTGSDNLESILLEHYRNEVTHLFDLAEAPPIRASLLRVSDDVFYILVNLHHIIADGWSMKLLMDAFLRHYDASINKKLLQLPTNAIEYADYAVWQNQQRNLEVNTAALIYFTEAQSQSEKLLNLPTDFANADKVSFRGGSVELLLEQSHQEKLKHLSQTHQVTLFSVLLSGLHTLMRVWTEQEGVFNIGTVVAGRDRTEIESVVGCFINMLPIALQPSESATLTSNLSAVHANVTNTLEHGNTPFDLIVDSVAENLSTFNDNKLKNPLFNVALLLQSYEKPKFSMGTLDLELMDFKPDQASLDLRFVVEERTEGLVLSCEYNKDMFAADTANLLVKNLASIYESMPNLASQDELEFDICEELKQQRARAKARQYRIAISSTFTAEPLAESLEYWAQRFELDLDLVFAPFNQVNQQLFNPSSVLLNKSNDFGVIIIRFEEWLDDSGDISSLEENITAFVAALTASRNIATHELLVMFTPSKPETIGHAAAEKYSQQLQSQIATVSGVTYLSHEDFSEKLMKDETIFDHQSMDVGKIPYQKKYFSLLGTEIYRAINAIKKPAYKVLVLDCDNTLWTGVSGEVGAMNVKITAARRHLQELLVDRYDQGILLALCSRNETQDVFDVLDHHPDMIVRREHVAASRINWHRKSENIAEMAQELNLGLDSFIFIDDDPLQCGEVSQNLPQVKVVNLPLVEDEIVPLIKNLWLLDVNSHNTSDSSRTQFYQANASRKAVLNAARGYAEFIESLNIEIDIQVLAEQQLERASELTYRTNQFNTTTIRLSHTELAHKLQSNNQGGFIASLKDRFGDYGIICVAVYSIDKENSTLEVSGLMVSCRAMERGVEYAMVRRLAQVAEKAECSCLSFNYRPSERNEPVRLFLHKAFAQFEKTTTRDGVDAVQTVFHVPTAYGLTVEPEYTDIVAEKEESPTKEKTHKITETLYPDDITELYIDIAKKYQTADAIHQSICGSLIKLRQSDTPYLAPRDELESKMALHWQQNLSLDRVGLNDHYFMLGGNSIAATRLISDLRTRWNIHVELVDLFKNPVLVDFIRYVKPLKPTSIERMNLLDRDEKLPLSLAQERLWYIQSSEPDSAVYNIPFAISIQGLLDQNVLTSVFSEIIARHEVFRTQIIDEENGPYLKVMPDSKAGTAVENVSLNISSEEELNEWLSEQGRVVFDLSGPLYRIIQASFPGNRTLIFINFHHLIADGWSIEVLLKEFLGFYYFKTLLSR